MHPLLLVHRLSRLILFVLGLILSYSVSAVPELTTYREAVVHPEWQLAMAEEIAALERTGTWELVPLPPHVRPITCKWVFKVKT